MPPSKANPAPRRRSAQTGPHPGTRTPQATSRAHAPAASVPQPASPRTVAVAGGDQAPARQPAATPDSKWPLVFQAAIPAWVLLPLRLFLGVTFVYAGLQKLTDPHYFRAGTPTSIATQITAFAHGTPLQGFLLQVALPHAILFGALVAYGELAIGLCTLAGLLMRPAAVFGLLLNLIFFLSASWRVSPYFYGADIVFVFGWITLILAGPAAGGVWPALDASLARRAERMTARLRPAQRAAVSRVLAVALGIPSTEAGLLAGQTTRAITSAPPQPTRRARGSVTVGQRSRGRGSATLARRELLRGAALGGGGMLVLVWLRSVLFPSPSGTPAVPPPSSSQGGNAAASATPASSATGTAATSPDVIGQVSQIAPNSAVSFTIPTNQDPGVLVRMPAGSFVAFDATCTHAGCPVQYDPSSHLLLCPCHGAAFDPAHNAAVVQGPTDTPLTNVPISVNNATGAITLT